MGCGGSSVQIKNSLLRINTKELNDIQGHEFEKISLSKLESLSIEMSAIKENELESMKEYPYTEHDFYPII